MVECHLLMQLQAALFPNNRLLAVAPCSSSTPSHFHLFLPFLFHPCKLRIPPFPKGSSCLNGSNLLTAGPKPVLPQLVQWRADQHSSSFANRASSTLPLHPLPPPGAPPLPILPSPLPMPPPPLFSLSPLLFLRHQRLLHLFLNLKVLRSSSIF